MRHATVELDAGTYEVLRARLAAHGAEVGRRAAALNARRLAAFGAAERRLLDTVAITTEQPCRARDVVPVGGHLLVGFSGAGPLLGLYTVDSDDVRPVGADWLGDDGFRHDLAELHRYYRDSRLLRLRRLDDRLLAVFRTGPQPTDTRVLRWSVDPDGTVRYLDNHGDRDHAVVPAPDVAWTPAGRADHVVRDRRPAVSVGGGVLVSTLDGALTVTVPGAATHTERVAEPLQSLADAEIGYAEVGSLVLVRVRPYREEVVRHLVCDRRTGDVTRLDGIGQACRRLPDDHGIVFPGGYYLADVGAAAFDLDTAGLAFERAVSAPGGEGVLYVFRDDATGRCLLLEYDLVGRTVTAPLTGGGFALFDDGTLVVLRTGSLGVGSPGVAADEPVRRHPVQVWRTPYRAEAAPAPGAGPLGRIGNVELVRAVADCLAIARLTAADGGGAVGRADGGGAVGRADGGGAVGRADGGGAVGRADGGGAVGWADGGGAVGRADAVLAACRRVLDRHHWLGEPDVGDLRTPLAAVRSAAAQVRAEYAQVRARVEAASADLDAAAGRVASLLRRTRGEPPTTMSGWSERLADLRRAQGRLRALREQPHIDTGRVDALAADLVTETGAAGLRALTFLADPAAFAPVEADLAELAAAVPALATVAEADPLGDRIAAWTAGLQAVTAVVGDLTGADATARSTVLRLAAGALGGLNRVRALLDARLRELRTAGNRAVFDAERELLRLTVTGGLTAADTPARCDDELTAVLLRLEDLQARFAADDGHLAELAAERDAVTAAFAARRQALRDEQARHAERLGDAAQRILATVRHRAGLLPTYPDIDGFFAADPLVVRLRAITAELRALGEPVRAAELESGLLTAGQEAGRILRDRAELFDDGGRTIRLGRHRFAVTTEPVDVVLVPDGDGLAVAVTGTDYRRPLTDAALAAAGRFGDRPVAAESPTMYRAEYLAGTLLLDRGDGLAALSPADLADLVRRAAEDRVDEGYTRGVHDADATAILAALLGPYTTAGLLRYPPAVRAAAQLYWAYGNPDPRLARRAAALSRAHEMVGGTAGLTDLAGELTAAAGGFRRDCGLPDVGTDVGAYLVAELAAEPPGFVAGAAARGLVAAFHAALGDRRATVEADLAALDGDLAARHQLARAWLGGTAAPDLPEAIALLLCDLPRYDNATPLAVRVEGLLGTHPRIAGGGLDLRLDDLLARTRAFAADDVPAFRRYQRVRTDVEARERARLRITDHRPVVPTGFVRNRLIDEVYLPLVGDNLARQFGTAAGQSGVLLLVSPPGYGKTTLLEYVASRLGLVLVTVRGPALGAGATSLDPDRAPDSAARHEVEKITFALELGRNVLLYLDDIQHVSPELLQRFVSLGDGQRRMEGVRDGHARTYDLRGKRFAVCLAGNPYTESGRRFRVPEMLTNRADVWNLGDVLAGRDDLFALSFIENALAANPVLAPLSSRDPADLRLLLRRVAGDDVGTGHPFEGAELDRLTTTLRHLTAVRDVVVAVNRAYVASAARTDAARTEPPFRLQGSYRDMNSIAHRIRPVMTDAEVATLVDDHYRAEAQLLGADAEANLLALAELRGGRTPAQAARWAEITAAYRAAEITAAYRAAEITAGYGGADPVAAR